MAATIREQQLPTTQTTYHALQVEDVGDVENDDTTYVLDTTPPSKEAVTAATFTKLSRATFKGTRSIPFSVLAQALGVKPRLYGPQGNLNVKVAEKFPEATEGAVIIGTYPNISAPVWDTYRAALEKYNAPDLDWNSLAGLGTWAAFEGFRLIVEKMVADGVTTIDHQTFLDAANATSNLDTGGMVAPLDFTKPWSAPGFSRIFNRNVYYDCVSGGVVAPCAEPGPADMTQYQG